MTPTFGKSDDGGAAGGAAFGAVGAAAVLAGGICLLSAFPVALRSLNARFRRTV